MEIPLVLTGLISVAQKFKVEIIAVTQVEHFFLHRKVPVVLYRTQVPFCEEKSVRLARVAFFRSDFIQIS